MSRIAKLIALFLLMLTPLLGSGCVSAELAKAMGATLEKATGVVAELEAQGVDYRVEAFLPTDVLVSWTPFAVELRLPNGHLKVLVSRGRGLGNRPVDFPPTPYEPPRPPAIQESPG